TTDFGQIEPLSSKNLSGLDFNASIFYGINWQLSSFVLGFEVDFSLINYDEKYSSGNIYYITQPTEPFSVTTNVKSRWIASIRPRLGYSWKSSLFYFTGGLAVTKLKYEFTFKDNFVGGHYANASSNKVLIGWTIGLGWEIKLSEKMGLALKTEYLYYNFQNQITENSKLSNTSTSFSHTVGFYVHSFRVGLTKLF
ncbi:MAG: outer membrane beta-barrel protein, partial [Spirochaetota bacterium]|nr:outer membrane beta-barrel protein [Spirochaetota bacterium]